MFRENCYTVKCRLTLPRNVFIAQALLFMCVCVYLNVLPTSPLWFKTREKRRPNTKSSFISVRRNRNASWICNSRRVHMTRERKWKEKPRRIIVKANPEIGEVVRIRESSSILQSLCSQAGWNTILWKNNTCVSDRNPTVEADFAFRSSFYSKSHCQYFPPSMEIPGRFVV